MKLILHNYRRCPYCIRVRLLLYLKGIEYEIVEEPLRVWTDWFLENVEDKRVPVLRIISGNPVTGDELIMQHSNQINLWLDKNFGEVEFTPSEGDPISLKKMEEWWNWFDEHVKEAIDTYKYGANLQFDKEQNEPNRKRLHELLEKIEEALEGKEYLIENRMTLADISLIPFVRQVMRTRGGEFDFSNLPNVERWTNAVIETEWFNDIVMKKVTVEVVDR